MESADIQKALAEINRREGSKPTLYVASDQYLSVLIENPSVWGDYVELSGSGIEILTLINNKNTINEYCQKHGIKTPSAIPYGEYMKGKPHEFPKIIKWTEKRIETAVNPIGKVKVCRNEKDLKLVEDAILKGRIDPRKLMIQTYIEGKNDRQFSVGGFFRDGKPLADVTVNQAKQYPQGISAMVLPTNGEMAKKLTKITYQFAKELDYSGFLEMEYKADSVSGELYLLDINPRPWGWVSILGMVYPDFYKVFEGERPQQLRQNVVWESPVRLILSRKNAQNGNVDDKLKDHIKAYDIKDCEDFLPSFMIYGMAFKKIMRRIIE